MERYWILGKSSEEHRRVKDYNEAIAYYNELKEKHSSSAMTDVKLYDIINNRYLRIEYYDN